MNRYLLPMFLLGLILTPSCKEKAPVVQKEPTLQINNQLTAEEKAGGVMTPEIMWKFGRLGTFSLSPDGMEVLYTVTDIDLKSEARVTNIFKIPSKGGNPIRLTTDGGSSPQWFNNGKSVAFVNNGNLCTVNSDGSGLKTVAGISDFEIFSISPDGNKIYFTKRVKLIRLQMKNIISLKPK
jgi:hypothetical protein